MPTQEERLETVEFNLRQFKTETIKAYGDMAYEIVIIKGLGEDSINRLARLSSIMEKRFDAVEKRLDRLETKFDEHTALLTQILERLSKN